MAVVEKLNIILKDATATKFKRIKQALGLESNTETIRMIINWYYEQHREEIEKAIEGPPKHMWHLNLNEYGVLVWDPDIPPNGWAVQIHFRPEGVFCEYCESSDCKHIHFALSKPDIQEVIRKRRKEGWKLPEV